FAHYGLTLYRFLGALQAQDSIAGSFWTWGRLVSFRFLPRVRWGRVVFAPAQWNVDTQPLHALGKKLDASGFDALRRWREKHRLPRFVMIGSFHEIPVDLESVLSVEAFLGLVRNHDSIELREMLPGKDELCVRGPEGRYVHELLIPFVQQQAVVARPPETSPRETKREFVPGSEWLYAKVYGGAVTLDRVLRGPVSELAASAVPEGLVDSWFFIRYADPRTHLRIRFHGDAGRLCESLLPRLRELGDYLLEEGLTWKLQLDTYDREVERYGGAAGIEIAEKIFHADSETVIEILSMLEAGEAGEEERWKLALLGTDILLDDFGFSLEEKRQFVTRARGAYGEDFVCDAEFKRSLGDRYRKDGRSLLPLIESRLSGATELRPGLDAFSRRSARLAPLVGELRSAESTGRLDRPLRVIAGSFVHMFLNRIFAAGHQKQEVVVYDFLSRLYGAVTSRERGVAAAG
ncbi:MAG: thiopeptide-type bacteriocin biosynthesis protein, partial [Acidobacteria bacterium]|nr:thiopeptide-type bacteriocin biosynthesis protein [Acidobacteriota bacterium]